MVTNLQCGRLRFDPWIRKIPWRREWQPTPIFFLGEFHGQRSLESYSPWGLRESDTTKWLTHMSEMEYLFFNVCKGFPCGSADKESACSAGDLGLIPGLGRSPGEGNGYPLQYYGLENSMDCIVHGITESQTRLSDFHFHILVGEEIGIYWMRKIFFSFRPELRKKCPCLFSEDCKWQF